MLFKCFVFGWEMFGLKINYMSNFRHLKLSVAVDLLMTLGIVNLGVLLIFSLFRGQFLIFSSFSPQLPIRTL